MIEEQQLGDITDITDNRITYFGYDANSNIVRSEQGRNRSDIGNSGNNIFSSTGGAIQNGLVSIGSRPVGRLVYDGLNRVVKSYNPEGGLTVTVFDGLGNKTEQRLGDFSPPTLNDNSINQAAISSDGAFVEWGTSQNTNGIVYAKRVGTGTWQAYGEANLYSYQHAVLLTGFTANTNYEYYIESKSQFGHTITSDVQTFRTTNAFSNVSITNVNPSAGGYTAEFSFDLAGSPSNLELIIGEFGNDAFVLQNTASVVPTFVSGTTYTATLEFTNPIDAAAFQIRWLDAEGDLQASTPEFIQQQQEVYSLDATITSTPGTIAGAYNVNVDWRIPLPLSEIGSYINTATTFTEYQVYASISATGSANEAKYIQQATLGADGHFNIALNNASDGPRVIELSYVDKNGNNVYMDPISVTSLNNLNVYNQSVVLDFPNVNTDGATMTFRYRAVGNTGWATLSSSLVNGLSANVSGLNEIDYEFEADLKINNILVNTSSGLFSMRQPYSISDVNDVVRGYDTYTVDADQILEFIDLTPLKAEDTIYLKLNGASYSIADGKFDLKQLSPGTYVIDLKLYTLLSGINTLQSNISGLIIIEPTTLMSSSLTNLTGNRIVTNYELDNPVVLQPVITATGTSTDSDNIYTYFDNNGHKIFSNEEDGVWSRYFYDERGNMVRQVKFKYRNPSTSQFVDTVQTLNARPSQADLEANYLAAVAAHDVANGIETIRDVTMLYDVAGNRVQEVLLSDSYADVINEMQFDRYGNKVVDIAKKGLGTQEQRQVKVYDAMGRLTQVSMGDLQFYDTSGGNQFGQTYQRFSYDIYGNTSTRTNERNMLERFSYDPDNRLISKWDEVRTDINLNLFGTSVLQTTYGYDNLGRTITQSEKDLTSLLTQLTSYEYNNHDQLTKKIAPTVDSLLNETSMQYDASGNLVVKTDARGNNEYFGYDGENRVVWRKDRNGYIWRTTYDAFGTKVLEVEPNGRITKYTVGAFGLVSSKTITFAASDEVAAYQRGQGIFNNIVAKISRTNVTGTTTHTESIVQDWMGRETQLTDTYGKNISNQYDDADRLIKVKDLATNKEANYTYNASGNRITENLIVNGVEVSHSVYAYNERNWLSGITSSLDYTNSSNTINQSIDLVYRYDQIGNRTVMQDNVSGNDNRYSYDSNNRFVSVFNNVANQSISAIIYDAFGNRKQDTNSNGTTTYTYDLNNRVRSSSAGETWTYDLNGNLLYNAQSTGNWTQTVYDAENQATTVTSNVAGKTTTTVNTYDGTGKFNKIRVNGDGYAFDEVIFVDSRYKTRFKNIENSIVQGAEYLYGSTNFTYDVNGNLLALDRGRKSGSNENALAFFEYNIDGQIIARTNKSSLNITAGVMRSYISDPDILYSEDSDTYQYVSDTELFQRFLFGQYGDTNSTFELNAYNYALGNPVAESNKNLILDLKKLSLFVLGQPVLIQTADIVVDTGINRTATARNIAARIYSGFSTLSSIAQAQVVAYIESKLPPSDAAIVDGTEITPDSYILISDTTSSTETITTDYAYQTIGGLNGLPDGSVVSHVVSKGESLQTIASHYYGSPTFWYLVADANNLGANDVLIEGMTLSISNVITNSVNDKDTYKSYGENEIIGSTSPEIQIQQKKKSWTQKLVGILIIIIIVVVAYYTAGWGASLVAAYGAAGIVLAALLGYAVGYATSYVTQTIAIAADLQEDYDWKSMKDMGKSFAWTAVAGGIAKWAAGTKHSAALSTATQAYVRAGVEIARQYYQNDGKITSWSGVALAMLPAGSEANSNYSSTVNALRANRGVLSAGLQIVEKSARKQGVNSMDWANLAAAAINGQSGTGQYVNESGSIRWGEVATQALTSAGLALVVSRQDGEEAALSYFGNQLGSIATGTLDELDTYDKVKANNPAELKARFGTTPYQRAQIQAQTNRDFDGMDAAFAATNSDGTEQGLPEAVLADIAFAEADRIQGRSKWSNNKSIGIGAGRFDVDQTLANIAPLSGDVVPVNFGADELSHINNTGYKYDANGLQVGPTVERARLLDAVGSTSPTLNPSKMSWLETAYQATGRAVYNITKGFSEIKDDPIKVASNVASTLVDTALLIPNEIINIATLGYYGSNKLESVTSAGVDMLAQKGSRIGEAFANDDRSAIAQELEFIPEAIFGAAFGTGVSGSLVGGLRRVPNSNLSVLEAKIENRTATRAEWKKYSSEIRASGQSLDNVLKTDGNFLESFASKEWPPFGGFLDGKYETVTLPKGTLIDRYGKPDGSYVSPFGESYRSRSLKPGSDGTGYNVFRLLEPIDGVRTGTVKPWFGYEGLGTQHRLPETVLDLLMQDKIEVVK